MKTLREATFEKHEIVENMPFNLRLLDGALNEEEYLIYLIQQFETFKVIENIGLPSEALARVYVAKEDIEELRAKGCKSDMVLKSTKVYTDYLKTLDKDSILPHIYLHYLAIMYGGQVIKRLVPSSGKLYKFENKKEAMQSIRRVQKDDWAEEANKGYDYMISIFEESETYCSANLR